MTYGIFVITQDIPQLVEVRIHNQFTLDINDPRIQYRARRRKKTQFILCYTTDTTIQLSLTPKDLNPPSLLHNFINLPFTRSCTCTEILFADTHTGTEIYVNS